MNACRVDSVDFFYTRETDGDHWPGNFVNEVAEGGVFLGRTSYDSKGPDGVLAVIDVFDLEDREVVGEAVVAEVVAEGAFGFCLAGRDGSCYDEVGVGGDHRGVRRPASGVRCQDFFSEGVAVASAGEGSGEGDFGESLG